MTLPTIFAATAVSLIYCVHNLLAFEEQACITISDFSSDKYIYQESVGAGDDDIAHYRIGTAALSGSDWIVAHIFDARINDNVFPVTTKPSSPVGLVAIHLPSNKKVIATAGSRAPDQACSISPHHSVSVNSGRFLVTLQQTFQPNTNDMTCWFWELNQNTTANLGFWRPGVASVMAAITSEDFVIRWPDVASQDETQSLAIENRATHEHFPLRIRIEPVKCAGDRIVYSPDRFSPGSIQRLIRLQQECDTFVLQTIPYRQHDDTTWKVTNDDFKQFLHGRALWCKTPEGIQRGSKRFPILVGNSEENILVSIDSSTGAILNTKSLPFGRSFDASPSGVVVGIELSNNQYVCYSSEGVQRISHNLKHSDRVPFAICDDGSIITRSPRAIERISISGQNPSILFALKDRTPSTE